MPQLAGSRSWTPVAEVVAAHSGPAWLSVRIAAQQGQIDALGSHGARIDAASELAAAVVTVVPRVAVDAERPANAGVAEVAGVVTERVAGVDVAARYDWRLPPSDPLTSILTHGIQRQ